MKYLWNIRTKIYYNDPECMTSNATMLIFSKLYSTPQLQGRLTFIFNINIYEIQNQRGGR